ncbi:ROK family protein [Streptomyces sp. NBC_01306]|uniref:ROK family protein n=1 Tax=Streptomyces sp. NBC_01306 TaxID=2903819 RepID=UPI00224DCB26|nr:ROK family protein [Streptomyces sp. NBC_01306]MCX4722388.1 ROK family protein [Streptomyces sp. NBC_01306]
MTPPHRPAAATSVARCLLGVDVGGTKTAAGLVSADGALLTSVVRPTPAAQGPAAVLDAIAAAVRELPGHHLAEGLGIGTGGVIDRDSGVVISANDLLPGWAGTRLSEELTARLALPVAADNDANVFALAEQTYGAGAGCRSALYVSVGTGIGGGLVTGGRLLRGAHSTAGEFGHIAVPEATGLGCNCGRTGHLEAVASGPAMTARFRELTGHDDGRGLRQVAALAGKDSGSAGDTARAVLAEGAGALGRALAGLVNTMDPERVVIGGGVASIGDAYWRPLTEAFVAELLPGPSGLCPVPAKLGPRAAVVGAAALLLEDRDAAGRPLPATS